jgi:hypothetical protein
MVCSVFQVATAGINSLCRWLFFVRARFQPFGKPRQINKALAAEGTKFFLDILTRIDYSTNWVNMRPDSGGHQPPFSFYARRSMMFNKPGNVIAA